MIRTESETHEKNVAIINDHNKLLQLRLAHRLTASERKQIDEYLEEYYNKYIFDIYVCNKLQQIYFLVHSKGIFYSAHQLLIYLDHDRKIGQLASQTSL